VAYSAKEGVSAITSLATDQNGDAIEVRNQGCGSFQIVWASAGATDAVVKIQESHDKTNWKDVSSKSVTIGAATGHDFIKFTAAELLSPYLRIVVVDNTENAATCTIRYFFKGA
jgi:hypothetical protein